MFLETHKLEKKIERTFYLFLPLKSLVFKYTVQLYLSLSSA